MGFTLITHRKYDETKNLGEKLIDATFQGNKDEVIKLLVEQKASVNYRQAGGVGLRPLMLAAGHGHSDIMVTLIQHGASAEFTDENGKTAFDWCKNDKVRATLIEAVVEFESKRPMKSDVGFYNNVSSASRMRDGLEDISDSSDVDLS